MGCPTDLYLSVGDLTDIMMETDWSLWRHDMNRKRILRLISLVMLIVAVVFVFCALSNPNLEK